MLWIWRTGTAVTVLVAIGAAGNPGFEMSGTNVAVAMGGAGTAVAVLAGANVGAIVGMLVATTGVDVGT